MTTVHAQSSTVLVVDDDADSRTWTRVGLQQAGYAVREATTAAQALESIAACPPDLLILDVMLPDMDGFALTRQLRQDAALATLPIILVTVLDDPASMVQGLEAGANDFLTKPLESSELLARVRTLLRLKRNQEELLAERNRTALLYRVSRELSADLDLDSVLARVLELTIGCLQASRGSIILLDEQGAVLRHIYSYQGQVAKVGDAVSAGVVQKGLAGWVIEHGEPVILPDACRDGRWLAVGQSSYVTRSVMAVPLLHPDRVVGVLTLTHEEQDHFGAADVDLLSSIAAQAAVALVNARLFEVVTAEKAWSEAILAGTADVIVATDRERRVTLLNPAAERAFGASFADAVGWPLQEALPNAGLVELFRQAEQAGPTPSAELVLPDGRVLFGTVSAVAAGPHADGGWVAVMHDITHLKQLDRMKNEFVSTVSHDLRTPLATIHGFADVLGHMVDGEAREYAQRIQAHTMRMAALVDELLDLGKIESGVEAVQVPCRLEELVAEAVEAASFQAQSRGVAVQAAVPRLSRTVHGNPLRLRQVLDNLLGNALKYTPAGGSVTVQAWEREDRVLVTVQDSGIGIPPEALPRVFEKFYRVPGAGTSQAPGTGLGLAIVKAIVEQHGGQVWAESQPGKGSTFGFFLPWQYQP